MKQGTVITRVVMIVLFVGIVLYFGIYAIKSFQEPFSTTYAYTYTVNDGVEATGFISHLKLPHYVTFQSKLSSVRGTRDEHSECGECDPHGTRVAHDPQSTRDPHDQPAESKEARDAAAL